MSKEPRISIVTVVRNAASELEDTILSVLEQKRTRAIDYLIIDGGSTDGTLQVIKRYADRLHYWVSEPDRGTYDAMNKGWRAADPESSILFLGAGDRVISLPERLDAYAPGDVLYGAVQMGPGRVFHPRADWHLRLYNTLHHQALLVPKRLHPEPPFDCRYPVYADFDFNQRMKKDGVNFVFCPQLIGYASPGGVSDRPRFTETLRIVRANFGFCWAALAISGYYATRILPLMKKLRPIRGV
ncbi:glycosyltransferase family 2 protein [Geomonas agri]|uniref:glycosyltransferase family 2 protein n=1 Tax=Geomonas agri TaxID=2873702 RepID=UPI001CD6B812|nr:glycosyltransferase family 2 protein [Geomonas agri]